MECNCLDYSSSGKNFFSNGSIVEIINIKVTTLVYLVLHPHGIATIVLKLDSWFYSYNIHQENKSDKERKIVRKK